MYSLRFSNMKHGLQSITGFYNIFLSDLLSLSPSSKQLVYLEEGFHTTVDNWICHRFMKQLCLFSVQCATCVTFWDTLSHRWIYNTLLFLVEETNTCQTSLKAKKSQSTNPHKKPENKNLIWEKQSVWEFEEDGLYVGSSVLTLGWPCLVTFLSHLSLSCLYLIIIFWHICWRSTVVCEMSIRLLT